MGTPLPRSRFDACCLLLHFGYSRRKLPPPRPPVGGYRRRVQPALEAALSTLQAVLLSGLPHCKAPGSLGAWQIAGLVQM